MRKLFNESKGLSSSSSILRGVFGAFPSALMAVLIGKVLGDISLINFIRDSSS